MIAKWLAFVRQVASTPGMVTGVRKVAFDQSFILTWEELTKATLTYEDLGYTKTKGRQLERIYWPQESMGAMLEKLNSRRYKPHSSVAVQMAAGIKDSRSQGYCMQSMVITQTSSGRQVDLYYRSTEVIKKFLADLVFFKTKLVPLFGDNPPTVIRFRFANTYLSAVFAPIFLRYEPKALEFFTTLRKEDPKFFRTFGLATRRFFNETHNYSYRTRVKMFEYYKEHCTTDPHLQKLLVGLTGTIEEDEDEDE